MLLRRYKEMRRMMQDETPASEIELDKMTKKQLVSFAEDNNITVGGNRANIVKQIEDYLRAPNEGGGDGDLTDGDDVGTENNDDAPNEGGGDGDLTDGEGSAQTTEL